MLKRYAFLIPSLLTICISTAQETLFTTGFDMPPYPFLLNTTDAGSQAMGANTWLVNNNYTGGSGEIICLGFPFGFTIPNTPAQPAAIENANGNYLHIASTEAVAAGVLNCSFAAADGLCTDPGNSFAAMSTDVTTTGMSEVSLSFWWLCNGGVPNYGEVYYSTNGGDAWTVITTPIAQYRNQPTWTQQTISIPEFADQATLRFGFRFVNNTSLQGGSDPGFGVDDISISATTGAQSIEAMLDGQTLCTGTALTLPYTATGMFNAGNTFTAELSDVNGSFMSPTMVGSIQSTTSGEVPVLIPEGITAGTGYRVRVNSSSPQITGLDNGSNLSVITSPNAGEDSTVLVCANIPEYALADALAGTADPGGNWSDSDGNSIAGGMLQISELALGDHVLTYTVEGGGGPCGASSATVTVTVDICAGVVTAHQAELRIISNDNGRFQLLANAPIRRVQVLNSAGQHVSMVQPAIDKDRVIIDLTGQAAAVYLVAVHTDMTTVTLRLPVIAH